MPTVDREKDQLPTAEEERLAWHEAAYAVAMRKLGYRLDWVSIEPNEQTQGHLDLPRDYDRDSARGLMLRRHLVEQTAMILHAPSAAGQLLRPGSDQTDLSSRHDLLHREMYKVEDSGSVQLTWCNYLWQRIYEVLAWPGQWKALVALARVLRTHRTLDGRTAEFYLKSVDDALKHDPSMPNAVLIGEIKFVCSPWHWTWDAKCRETSISARRTDLPEAVEKIDTTFLRPLRTALHPLSIRAQRCLGTANIRTVFDLRFWNARSLGSIKGVGRLTLREIVDAAERAGVPMAADDAPSPWSIDPERWRS
jgi:hypothetical protein